MWFRMGSSKEACNTVVNVYAAGEAKPFIPINSNINITANFGVQKSTLGEQKYYTCK